MKLLHFSKRSKIPQWSTFLPWKGRQTYRTCRGTRKKAILESYLPAMLDKEATKKLIESLVSELQIADLKTGRGLLMKELMAKYKSELDGSLVNQIINEML